MKLSKHLLSGVAIILFLQISQIGQAQTSHSSIVSQMSHFGVNFYPNNEVRLIMSGKEKFDLLFEDIKNAKSSVHLEYFNFRNDSIASLLFDILREKRKQGVEVRALFDGFGNDSNNKPLKKQHIMNLRADSIKIYEYDPVQFPWINHIWPRDHRKIVIIDGRIAYTGGMNVADYYIVGTEQVGEWRDMHCRIEGPVVNEFQDIFARIWQKVTKEQLLNPKYYQGEDKGDKLVGIANREPNKTNKIMRQLYISSLDNAQDSVKIINPYLTLTPSVKNAIYRAIKRGVKVDIMISAKSDIPLTPDAVFYNAHQLMKKGANVWLYQPGFHHSKIMTVDGKFCTLGSTNLDARSLRYDYEVNALIVNQQTTQEMDNMFIDDTQNSVLLTNEEWDKFRTRWQKARGWFAQLLYPFL